MTWRSATIGEIADIKGGKRVPTGYQFEKIPTPYPYITVSAFTKDGGIDLSELKYISAEIQRQISRYTISTSDLYISIAGTIGKTGRVPEEIEGANLTENACKLVLKPFVDREFVYYFTLTDDFKRQVAAATRIAAQPKLALERLSAIEFRVPPLAEQKRIVAILDKAFENIARATENAERNLANARELLAAVRLEKFNALLDAWSATTLGDVCKFENGDRGANYPGKQHRVAEGVPFINAGHLTETGIDFSEMDYISPERFALLANGKIKPKDVLFCLRGSLGKFACVNEMDNGAIASSLVILRPTEKLNLAYLLEYLAGPICAAMIRKLKGGAAQPNLGAQDLKKFEIPLPTADVQRSTAEELSSLAAQTRELEVAYRTKAACCGELRQALLHKAFSGQLTGKESIAA
jgi:type I restriction enzyme S subunit